MRIHKNRSCTECACLPIAIFCRFFKDELSETTQSYLAKCQPRVSFGDANKLRATNFKMDKDLSNFNEYNTTHDSQYTPHIISSKPKAVENPMKSSLQYGDQDKSENPISDYRDHFLGHDALLTKPKRAANKHLTEGSSTFLGDERLSHFETSSAEQFRGLRLPRITPFPRVRCLFVFLIICCNSEILVKKFGLKHVYSPADFIA